MKALVYQGTGLRGWDAVDDPAISHEAVGDTMSAYDPFADAANSGAPKVVLEGSERLPSSHDHITAGLLAGAT